MQQSEGHCARERNTEQGTRATFLGYRLVGKLGEGGFGEVWEAICPDTNRRIAIKRLHPEYESGPYVDGPSVAQRFIAEADLLMRLSHPNLVRVFKGPTRNPPYAYVMERLKGVALSAFPATTGRWLAQVFEQVAGALAYLHNHGIVHRDVKADNIFVCDTDTLEQPEIRLLDLGVCKSLGENPDVTARGTLLGTAQTTSPECFARLQGVQIDITPAADQWAFGVTLFRQLTGRLPFEAEELNTLIDQVQRAPTPIVELQGRLADDPVARALVPIVRRCLAKHPDFRFKNMAAVHHALLAAQKEESPWSMTTCPDLDEIETQPVDVSKISAATRQLTPPPSRRSDCPLPV